MVLDNEHAVELRMKHCCLLVLNTAIRQLCIRVCGFRLLQIDATVNRRSSTSSTAQTHAACSTTHYWETTARHRLE
jgi:hypothetical protein